MKVLVFVFALLFVSSGITEGLDWPPATPKQPCQQEEFIPDVIKPHNKKVYEICRCSFPNEYTEYGTFAVSSYFRTVISKEIPGIVIVASDKNDAHYELVMAMKDEKSYSGFLIMISKLAEADKWEETYSMTFEEFFPKYKNFIEGSEA